MSCTHLALAGTFTLALTLSSQLQAQTTAIQPSGTVTTTNTPAADFIPDVTPPHGTYPEIVRLSLVEGDVRIARGKQDAKLTGNTWEQAAPGIPLQSGFNLATGPDGRAEIEFEDASTVYLAPSSALALADLTTKDGIPHTTLTLLSGSVTLNIKPNLPGDSYRIETPTHAIGLNYGDVNYTRVTSYLDGLQVTPMEDTHLVFNRVNRTAPAGTTYELSGYAVRRTHLQPTPDLAAFDAWVKQRVAARDAAMQSVMQQAGLKTPLPGLADLAGKGAFVPCAPYGTCWQPTNGWVPPRAANPHPASTQTSSSGPATDSHHSPSQPRIVLASMELPAPQTAGAISTYDPYDPDDADFDDFPCDPWLLWYRDASFFYPDSLYSYDWAVCHAGFWINRNNHYLWVAGTHKHHRCPVRWVKYQGKLGFVPMHPRDRHGELPVNLRHGLYTRTDKPGQPIQRLQIDARSSPHLLDVTPRDFRSPAPPLLARADSPQLDVHFMHESPRASTIGASAHASSLTFDPHSNRFMLATRVTDGGRTHTFTEPLSNRGGHVVSSAAGGFRSGSTSSGGGGFSHAGGYSGGAGHPSSGGSTGGHSGGGGGFSGGGGSHGGGGGGGFSGGSSSSSAGGGGGHH